GDSPPGRAARAAQRQLRPSSAKDRSVEGGARVAAHGRGGVRPPRPRDARGRPRLRRDVRRRPLRVVPQCVGGAVMADDRVAVVDPYSSGALLAPAFAEHGYACVAVQTSREAPELFRSSFRPDDFDAIVYAANGAASTASELARRDVRHVLAGSEPGVELADELAELLGLPANGAAKRSARRDKYLMGEAVCARGLQAPAQFQSPRLDELQRWAD